jgi:hypothetical protein
MTGTTQRNTTRMEDYQRILRYCKKELPHVIYVSIGCALDWNQDPQQIQQQYPVVLDTFPGTRVCILIDPSLEYPPKVTRSDPALTSLPIPPPAYDTRPSTPIVKDGVIFFPVYRAFEFTNPQDSEFLHTLCSLCVETHGATKLIVQDYTGRDIRPHYPTDIFGDAIRPWILYDMTYRDSGCYVDFSTVHVLRDHDGNFVHPDCLSLRQIRQIAPARPRIVRDEIKRRTDIVCNYLYRRYAVQAGYKEPADWCSPANVMIHLRQLTPAYGLPNILTQTNLKSLILVCLQDVGDIMDKEVSAESVYDLLDKNSYDFINLVSFLRTP